MSNIKTITREVHVADDNICLDGDENGEDNLVIEFDEALISRIKELQEVVIAAKAHAIEEFNFVPAWDTLTMNDEPLRVDCSCMHVSKDEVWWTCFFKNSPTEINISAIPIVEISA